jgi:hypothetical protein
MADKTEDQHQQGVVAKARVELRTAIGSLELVLAQFGVPDGPWSSVQLSLFNHRIDAAVRDLKHLAAQVAVTGEECDLRPTAVGPAVSTAGKPSRAVALRPRAET